jgi:hypothetical protein
LKTGPFLSGESMSQRVYKIRKAIVIPLGVDAFLLLCLLATSLLLKGDSTERIVVAIFFLPTLYFFLECLVRRVIVAEEGLSLQKLWRKKAVSWEEITHVGCLSLHKKVYLLLTTVKGIFIVSNAYEKFAALAEEIVERVGLEKVEEEVRLQSGRFRTGIANIVSAWVAAAFMVGIILIKILPFVV